MKKMTAISQNDAKNKYGINSSHSISEDGELRFRLTKKDGTAYIRTEAPPNGGWQDSHWHNEVKETYIVQRGWVGYAELIDEKPTYRIYNEGESFTTQPHRIHTIYMPKDVVTHTVKHGDTTNEKRLESEKTNSFDKIVQRVSEAELKTLSNIDHPEKHFLPIPTFDEGYSNAYKHFDNLIWQVPAWSTGIFALFFAGISQFKEDSTLINLLNIDLGILMGGLFFSFGLLHLVLSHALYRFRWHQIGVKAYTPNKPYISPQTNLQLVVNMESAILFVTSCVLFKIKLEYAIIVIGSIFLLIISYQEILLIKKGKKRGLPISTKS